MADKLVLVTGANGFIAAQVVQKLQVAGYRVRGTIRSLNNEDKVVPLKKLVPEAKHPLELVEAELCSDSGWDTAVSGCWAVVHVATTSASLTEDIPEEKFIETAVGGTLRVLRAVSKAGIKKVVITGSISAIHGSPIQEIEGKIYTEEDHTDLDFPTLEKYAKSKTMAEKAAWDFIEQLPHDEKIELTVILPSLVWGPPLLNSHKFSPSVSLANMMLTHAYPGSPNMDLAFCDVRDVAEAHVKALVTPAAIGERIIINTASVRLPKVAKILSKEFGPQGYFIFTNTVPYFVFWAASFFNKKIIEGGILNKIGKNFLASNAKMVRVLGIEPTPFETTAHDMAYAMIDLGITYRAKNYKKVGSRAHTIKFGEDTETF